MAPANAQEQAGEPAAAEQGVADIVVTAQRRSESIQKVPVAITALTGAQLESRGVANIEGIHYDVPSLTLGTQTGVPRIVLRGVGLEGTVLGQEAPVAAHLNGVYLGRPINLLSSFYDVDRVEVLRGPQGTLYGRNTTGGAINITTRRPGQDLDGYITARYGNYNDVKVEGAIGGALDANGMILQRVAFTFNQHDGYGRNITIDKDIDDLKTWGFRSTTVLNPSDDVQITFIGDYDRQDDRSGQYHYLGQGGNTNEPGSPGIVPFTLQFGGVVPAKRRDDAGDFDPLYKRTAWGLLGEISWDASDVINIKALTGYRKSKWVVNTNLGGGSFISSLWDQGERAKQFSEDIQLTGTLDRFKFVVGAYYYRENFNGDQHVPINGLGFGLPDVLYTGYYGGARIKTNAIAFYTQGTYNLTDELSITLGGRYSSEKKRVQPRTEFDLANPDSGIIPNPGFNPFIAPTQSKRWSSFTPKFGIECQINPLTMVYVSATKGFKSGSFNAGAVQPAVDPEMVWAYEAGIKTTAFDRRLRFNLAGFYYDYKDLQVSIIRPGGTSNTLENAAALESYGLEAEITALPTPELELTATAAWLHARYKNYITSEEVHPAQGAQNLDGFTSAQAPNYTINLSAQYTLPTSFGSLALRGEAFFVDKIYFNQFDRDVLSQGAHSRQNVYLTAMFDDNKWRVTGYVRNLSNGTHMANAIQTSIVSGHALLATYEAPRTYGIEISRKF